MDSYTHRPQVKRGLLDRIQGAHLTIPSDMQTAEQRIPRLLEVPIGLGFVALGTLAGHFGIDGLAEHLAGSLEAPADPLAVTVAVAAALWLIPTGVRLVAGSNTRTLLSPLGLILCGLTGLGGGIWMVTLDRTQIPIFLGFAGFGILAIRVGLKRWRERDGRVRDAV